jgi:hypothetical protein
LFALLLCGTSAAVTGCGMGTVVHSSSGVMAIQGQVRGGQQPVGESSIQLYTVGKGGNGSVASPMLKKAVSTKPDGTFDIAGDYTCGADDDQVYIVATGGNPGLAPKTNNLALVLMTAFGSCVNLLGASYLEINEITTAAAAWALTPFMLSAGNIGSTAGNAKGIASAFLNARLLADSSTGLAATLPSNLSVETQKLYALADALAPCVNSNGLTGCAKLFAAATPAGGLAPANTLNAALSIVQHPGQNVAAVFGAINAQAPYPTTMQNAPNDWTMSLTVTGGGLNSPTALGVDGFNNIWVANYPGSLSAFSAQGTPFNGAGYGAGMISEVYGLAVDFNNNVWVTNEEAPGHDPTAGSVTALGGVTSGSTGGVLFGKSYIYDTSIDYPFAVAADPNGNILIANNANSSVTIYNNNGVFVESGIAGSESSLPVALAPDLAHGVWLANQGDNTVTHVSSAGVILAHSQCCDGANGVATDSLGNAWISNYYGGSVSELSSDGTVTLTESGGGLSGLVSNAPSGIVVDASQNVWVANYYGANFSELAGNGGTLAAGTAISPAAGYGLDANLLLPFTIAPDGGGNLWVSNFGLSTLTMFFGLATPTTTPLRPAPLAP